MRHYLLAAPLALMSLAGGPALGAGPIVITAATVAAGNVTPGDSPGYPATITQPGSYVLGSDLAPETNQDGITIYVSNVTIDLGGYTIKGNGSSRFGVAANPSSSARVDYVTVKNGNISNMFSGVDSQYFIGWTVDRMRISEFEGTAVFLGKFSALTNSTLVNQSAVDDQAVSCLEYCRIENNTVSSRVGIAIGTVSIISGNSISVTGPYAIATAENAFVGYGNNTIIGSVTGPRALAPNRCYLPCP